MLMPYELETLVKEYQEMRLNLREEAIRRMLIQPQPRQPFRLRFHLPKFILRWIQQHECAEPLQDCPELA